jgi:hypothetical protein
LYRVARSVLWIADCQLSGCGVQPSRLLHVMPGSAESPGFIDYGARPGLRPGVGVARCCDGAVASCPVPGARLRSRVGGEAGCTEPSAGRLASAGSHPWPGSTDRPRHDVPTAPSPPGARRAESVSRRRLHRLRAGRAGRRTARLRDLRLYLSVAAAACESMPPRTVYRPAAVHAVALTQSTDSGPENGPTGAAFAGSLICRGCPQRPPW